MKKPKIAFDIRSANHGGLALGDLRTRLMADPKDASQVLDQVVRSDKVTWQSVLAKHSLRDLFNALADIQVEGRVDVMGQERTIMTSAFPLFAGGLSVSAINEAYEAVPTIGQDLVTDMESNKKWVQVGGVLSHVHGGLETGENQPFPLVGASQERFDIGSNRKGLRMEITQEMIEENDTEGLLERLNALGEIPAEDVEVLTLDRVTDYDGSAASAAEPYALRINKVGKQLYTTTANNPGTRTPSGTRLTNRPLVSTTSLEAARALLALNQNSRGLPIAMPVSQMILLAPDALASTASKILNSELEPGVENEVNDWGPRGRNRPTLRTTSFLDRRSTTAWYLGAFKKQFKRKWKIRMETVTAMGDLVTFLRSRVAFEARVAWDVEVGAQDYVYVVQCLAATSSPKDD